MRKPILIIITAVTIAITLSGCVNKRIVNSYDQYLSTAGKEYIHYVETDPTLDTTDKTIRYKNHAEAQKVVDKFRNTKWSW